MVHSVVLGEKLESEEKNRHNLRCHLSGFMLVYPLKEKINVNIVKCYISIENLKYSEFEFLLQNYVVAL